MKKKSTKEDDAPKPKKIKEVYTLRDVDALTVGESTNRNTNKTKQPGNACVTEESTDRQRDDVRQGFDTDTKRRLSLMATTKEASVKESEG